MWVSVYVYVCIWVCANVWMCVCVSQKFIQQALGQHAKDLRTNFGWLQCYIPANSTARIQTYSHTRTPDVVTGWLRARAGEDRPSGNLRTYDSKIVLMIFTAESGSAWANIVAQFETTAQICHLHESQLLQICKVQNQIPLPYQISCKSRRARMQGEVYIAYVRAHSLARTHTYIHTYTHTHIQQYTHTHIRTHTMLPRNAPTYCTYKWHLQVSPWTERFCATSPVTDNLHNVSSEFVNMCHQNEFHNATKWYERSCAVNIR